MDWFQRAGLGLVAAACLAAVAPFDTTASTVYRDSKYKFSLYRFDKWEQVPVEVDEEYTVAKFYEPGSKGDSFRPAMEILRFSKKPDEPATPEQDKLVRYIYRGFGKDKCTMEVHDMMIGESNTKVVEYEFARKK